MIIRSICHLIDIINVIIVARQGHGTSESSSVDRRIIALEVGLEIAYAAVVIKYGAESFQLVKHGVFGGVLKLLQKFLACHMETLNGCVGYNKCTDGDGAR